MRISVSARNERYGTATIAGLRHIALLLASLLGAACQVAWADKLSAPVVDARLVEKRAQTLLSHMTQAEKIQMVHGVGLGVSPLGGAGYIPGLPRLGIPAINSADSASGVNVSEAGATAAFTAFPAPLALAASWDLSLAETYGRQIARELRASGFVQGLGGSINLARDPRNGRTFEYLGEDPVLAGRLLARRVQATQTEKVVATVKHFAMNDQETRRKHVNVEVDERSMHEIHLRGFEIAIREGRPGYVMCAYNGVNGQPSCMNPKLLSILKKDWGFDGVVQSDWFSFSDTRQAALAGVDEEQPGSPDDSKGWFGLPTFFNQKLAAAVADGDVPQARLDDMVLRKLRVLIRTGILDAPPGERRPVDRLAGVAVAKTVALQSAVLLKNEGLPPAKEPVLPLDAKRLRKVVVIGGHADVGVMSGGGTAGVPAPGGGAVACLKPGTKRGELGVFPACATWYPSSPLMALRAKLPGIEVAYFDGMDTVAATLAAARADVAIVFATQYLVEDSDAPDLGLPDPVRDPANQAYDQDALIEAVASKAQRTVVVLETGSAVTMPWLARVHSVLQAWYPGIEGGEAIAALLVGEANPSGKLPLTFPRSEADLPQPSISKDADTVRYAEGLLIGYRWYDAKGIEPLFPFGHGLSYTRFGYSNPIVNRLPNGNVEVAVTVQNTGAREGAEVVQVYAALPKSEGEPPKRLVAWAKVVLKPGESQRVRIAIEAADLTVWDETKRAWRAPVGDIGFAVGGSSRDLMPVALGQ